MTLLAVREQFAELSGRHDLVTDFSGDDFTNNASNIGADFFIDSGQRLLDRKMSFTKSYAWYKQDCAIGSYKLNVPYCTTIKRVYMMGIAGERNEPVKKRLDYMKQEFPDIISGVTNGTPLYYTPIIINLAATQSLLTTANFTDEFTYDSGDIMFADTGDHFAYNGIWWMPPTDVITTVSILGRFHSPKLTGDTIKTYWTEMHPDILLLAALYSLERFYRNREGMNDYMTAILDAAIDLDRDVVEEEIQDINSEEV